MGEDAVVAACVFEQVKILELSGEPGDRFGGDFIFGYLRQLVEGNRGFQLRNRQKGLIYLVLGEVLSFRRADGKATDGCFCYDFLVITQAGSLLEPGEGVDYGSVCCSGVGFQYADEYFDVQLFCDVEVEGQQLTDLVVGQFPAVTCRAGGEKTFYVAGDFCQVGRHSRKVDLAIIGIMGQGRTPELRDTIGK